MVGKLSAVSGTLQFVKEPGTNVSVSNLDQLVCGPSGAVYGAGLSQGSNNGANIVKFNSDGTMAWQSQVDSGGYPDMDCGPMRCDASENLYVPQYSVTYAIVSTKVSNAGAVLGSLRLAVDGSLTAYSIGDANFDSSGNVIIASGVSNGSYVYGTVVKATLAGAVQWSAIFDVGGTVKWCACELDSAGNIFVASLQGAAAGVTVAKYSASGALLLNRTYFYGSGVSGFSMHIDAADNLYIAAAISTTVHIAKIKASDASLVWGRAVSGFSSLIGRVSLNVDRDYVWMACSYTKTGWSSYGSWVLAKLPTDGSRTGSYALTGCNGAYTVTIGASSAAASIGQTTVTGGTYAASLTSGVMGVRASSLWNAPVTLSATQSSKTL